MLKKISNLSIFLKENGFLKESLSLDKIIKVSEKNIISSDQVIVTSENTDMLSPELDPFFSNLKSAITNRMNFQLIKYYNEFIRNNEKGFYEGMESKHYNFKDQKNFVVKDYEFFKDYFFSMFESAQIIFDLTGESSSGEDTIATNTIGYKSIYMRLDFYLKKLIEIGILDISDRVENLLSSGFYIVKPDDDDYEKLMSLKYGKSYIEGKYNSEEKFDIKFISKISEYRESINDELNYIVKTIDNGDMDYIFFHEISHFKSEYFNEESSSLKDDFVKNKHIEWSDRSEQSDAQYDLKKEDLEHVNIYLQNIKLLSLDKYNSSSVTPEVLIKIFNEYRDNDDYSYSSGDLKANTHRYLHKLIRYYDSLDSGARKLFLDRLAARINSQARAEVFSETKTASRLSEIKKIAQDALDSLSLEDFEDKDIVGSRSGEELAQKIDSSSEYKNMYRSMLYKIYSHLNEGCYEGNKVMMNNISLSEYYIIKSFPESLALEAISLYEKKDSDADNKGFSERLSKFLSDKFDISPSVDIYGDSNFPYEPEPGYRNKNIDNLRYFSLNVNVSNEMKELMRNENYKESFLYKNIVFEIASDISKNGLARGFKRYFTCSEFKFPIIMYADKKMIKNLNQSFLEYKEHIRFIPIDTKGFDNSTCSIPPMSMDVHLTEDFFKKRPEFTSLEAAFKREKAEGRFDDHHDVFSFIKSRHGRFKYITELIDDDNFKKEISSLVEKNIESDTYIEYGKFLLGIAKEVYDKKRRLALVYGKLGNTMSLEDIVREMKKENLISKKDLKVIQDITLRGKASCKVKLLEKLTRSINGDHSVVIHY